MWILKGVQAAGKKPANGDKGINQEPTEAPLALLGTLREYL